MGKREAQLHRKYRRGAMPVEVLANEIPAKGGAQRLGEP